MELSEHESRILNEIQQDLAAGDPLLARTLSTATIRGTAFQRMLTGTTVMGLGVGLMIFALALGSMPMGAVAFAAMTVGAYVGLARLRRFRMKGGRKLKSADSDIAPDQ